MNNLDTDLRVVAQALSDLDPTGERVACVLRQTLDQLYDGQHTGRYRWDQLHKTEKTHCGTLVEINLHREFQFGDGIRMDYEIDGVDVDCKYSQSIGGWMIPIEAMGHLCMLLWADDAISRWSLGLVRITDEILSKGGNRDSKRTITSAGRNTIHWIHNQQSLPPNILLQLPRQVVDQVMALKSGQQRIDQIFRVAQQQRIGRGVIATLGQQNDYMKRVRDNGGSRSRLRPEGIIILGHYDEHKRIAKSLNIPVPQRGESVSVRVSPASKNNKHVAQIDGGYWKVADEEDEVTEAPNCSHAT